MRNGVRGKHVDAASLEQRQLRLEEEMDNLQHELRRVRDSLERVSGMDHRLQIEAQRLQESIDLCRRDLADIRHRSIKVPGQGVEPK